MKSNVFDRTISVVQRHIPYCGTLSRVRCATAFILIGLINLPTSLHAACNNEVVRSSNNSVIQSWMNDAAKISKEEQHCENIPADNASRSAIANGEYIFRGLDLSERETNSFGQPVIGGETTSTRLLREGKEAATQNTITLKQGIVDQFTSGGSYAYDILSGLGRKTKHVNDPSFDPSAWIDKNRYSMSLDAHYFSTIMGASSESEAVAIAENISDRESAQKRIQRMGGLAQLLVYSLAALPDAAIVLVGAALVATPFKAAFKRNRSDKSKTHTLAV
ncbi:hypothetical protein [Agrobacterium sp. CG674]